MGIKKKTIININLFLFFFLAFSGYYATLILLANLGNNIGSRNYTIPLRFIIVLFLVIIFLQKPRIKLQKGLVLFLIFAVAYLSRIFIEYIDLRSIFHISETEFFLYFTSFVLVPLVLTCQFRLSESNYNYAFLGLMGGTLILSLFTLYFYNDMIGNVARISLAIKRGENYISPLALSYVSALGIGVGIAFIITNNLSFIKKLFIYTSVSFSFIPFFLGASRGSILALSLPFIFYFICVEGIKNRVVTLISISILAIVLIILTQYLGFGIFGRFANIYHDIEVGSSSAARIQIWHASLIQFVENPVFGNSLNCEYINHYPHNILIEILITTGIVGFIPFVLFLQRILIKMKMIVRQNKRYFWICVVFIQAFIQNMFSGSIYAAGWLAMAAGLVIGLNTQNGKLRRTYRY